MFWNCHTILKYCQWLFFCKEIKIHMCTLFSASSRHTRPWQESNDQVLNRTVSNHSLSWNKKIYYFILGHFNRNCYLSEHLPMGLLYSASGILDASAKMIKMLVEQSRKWRSLDSWFMYNNYFLHTKFQLMHKVSKLSSAEYLRII